MALRPIPPRDYRDDAKPVASPLLRFVLLAVGLLCVGLGTLGVVTPILPTTPFLIVAAACFARASPRLYQRLLANATFGPLIRDWREQRAIPRRAKLTATAAISVTIGSSAVFFVEPLWLRILLVATGGTLCTWIWRQRTPDAPRRL
ncbi:YbaN family protein [Myxococcota bacterium]|nr:YbaN family protein [Myxococcota bacterium]MCZ7617168.1 YbaN family protein [Myxococcota bacterium]